MIKNKYFTVPLPIFIAGGLLFYYFFDPESSHFLLQCPFKFLTGFDCPGCGSQRAIHAALHGEIRKAFNYNPLFLTALPYITVGIFLELFGLKYIFPKIRKTLYGKTAIYIVMLIILLFFILRNI